MICRYIATVMKVKTDIIILITVIGLAMICRYIATVMKVKTDIIALITVIGLAMICRYIATVMKVKTDIVALITAIGLAMILVIMYVKSFKIDVFIYWKNYIYQRMYEIILLYHAFLSGCELSL